MLILNTITISAILKIVIEHKMGNHVIQPLFIGEQLHHLFKTGNMLLGTINTLDFFPMLKNKRIATKITINSLHKIIDLNTNAILPTIQLTSDYKEIYYLQVNEEDKAKIIEEEVLSQQIYHIIEEAHHTLSVDGDVHYFIGKSHIFKDKMLFKRLINHPNVNSLLASVKINNLHSVLDYLYKFDPRSNNMEIYYSSLQSSTDIQNIIRHVIITRILLEKEVFSSISYDIWNYYCISRIIFI